MTQASITTYMPGDILFYASIPDNIAVDKAISMWEGNSPIVHVAIAVSAVLKVEALGHGVVKTPIVQRNIYKDWLYHKNASPLVPETLSNALLWLDSQVGQMYGAGDIVNAILDKFEHSLSIDLGDHYDCSGLATEFLIIAGGIKKLAGVNPHKVTPAQLADMLGPS